MSSFQPPGGQFPGPMPGRIIRKVQRYPMPDGTVREKWFIQVTEQAPDGTVETREESFVVPPLDDGLAPDDMTDVLYCLLCQRLVMKSAHSFVCHACGSTYCVNCRVPTEVGDEQVALCPPCAEKVNTPRWVRFLRRVLWDE